LGWSTKAGGVSSLSLFGVDDLIPNAGPGDVERARRLSQYFTPARLANRIAAWADLRGRRVLEPSAGGGALRRAALEAGAFRVDCVELDPRFVESLELEELGRVYAGSFLDLRPIDLMPADVVLLNPPYEDGLDGLFLAHALEFAPRAVALVRLAALAGKDRGAALWANVQITRIAILSSRPEFEGELAAGGAKSDFVVVEYQRRSARADLGASVPLGVPLGAAAALVVLEHWAGAWS